MITGLFVTFVSGVFTASLIGYVLGSIPAGYLVGRIAGIDIREKGSGNIGATNVVRVIGKRYGYPVFLFDFLKGVIAVALSARVGHRMAPETSADVLAIVGGVSAVVGHSFPIWLGFKGGKGVATSVGVIFGLMPLAAAAVLLVWIIAFQVTRYVSVASMAAAFSLPVLVAMMLYIKDRNDWLLFYFSVALAVLIIFRHRSNISRLVRGTEPRFRRP